MHTETNQRFVIYTNLYHKVHLSTVCMLPSASSSVSTTSGKCKMIRENTVVESKGKEYRAEWRVSSRNIMAC